MKNLLILPIFFMLFAIVESSEETKDKARTSANITNYSTKEFQKQQDVSFVLGSFREKRKSSVGNIGGRVNYLEKKRRRLEEQKNKTKRPTPVNQKQTASRPSSQRRHDNHTRHKHCYYD